MIRDALLRASASRGMALAFRALESLGGRAAHRLPVLAYHRVAPLDDDGSLYPGLISSTPDAFAEQMQQLAADFHPLTADELLEIRHRGSRPPPGAVVVTFDDGYVDFARHAWPILRDAGVPVILFVPTDYPDHPELGFWWDRLYAALRTAETPFRLDAPNGPVVLREHMRTTIFRQIVATLKQMPDEEARTWLERMHAQLPDPGPCHAVLDWNTLASLASQGVTVSPHSRSHRRLDRIPQDRLTGEIAGSFEDLKRRLPVPVAPLFAYPDGGHDKAAYRAVASAGYAIAFTTRRGVNDVRHIDWLRLQRINIGARTPLSLLRAQVGVWPARGMRPWTPSDATMHRPPSGGLN